MARLKAKESNTKKPSKTKNRKSMTSDEFEGSDYAKAPSPSRTLSERDSRLQDLVSDVSDYSSDDDLHHRIAEKAYLLYEAGGFKHGNHLEHWLEAERQIKTLHV